MAIGAPRGSSSAHDSRRRVCLLDTSRLLAGISLSVAVMPLLAHFLYGIQPTNLANYAVMLIGVLVVSVLARFPSPQGAQ